MKKYIFKSAFLAALFCLTACSKEDSLDPNSVLPEPQVDNTIEGTYIRDNFTDPYKIRVLYMWDRNQYGDTRDVLRNLYPPKSENVIPALEMVKQVWINTYNEGASPDFIKNIRPFEFVIAGGAAYNEDQTRTLGLASSGVRVTLYEVDDIIVNPDKAMEFIHTIQHEYIHIINQAVEFSEKDFGKETMGSYTPSWMNVSDQEAHELGFVTPYASSSMFEDFAETAAYLLTNTEAQYAAFLESFKIAGTNTYRPGRAKIMYKVNFVRDYFKTEFGVDFQLVCKIANENAANSPLLNPKRGQGALASKNSHSPYGIVAKGEVHFCAYDWSQIYNKK